MWAVSRLFDMAVGTYLEQQWVRQVSFSLCSCNLLFFKHCLQQGGAVSGGIWGQLKSAGTIYHPVSPFQSRIAACSKPKESPNSGAISNIHFCLSLSAQSPSDWRLSIPPAALNSPSCLCLGTLALLAHKHAQRHKPGVCTYPSRDADKQLNR